ncbi:MAG TPA: type II toxin-antitoxin system CcdA family antitoxin [Acidimicrobiales bacterium]
MSRLNVYVPDELAEEARNAGLNVSALTQDAIRATLAAGSTDAWLASLAGGPARTVTHDAVLDALDAARAESPTRHG